jgi:hypothetical protein
MCVYSLGITATSGPRHPHYRGFTITLRHTAHGRTPLEEWSGSSKELHLTKHDYPKRQASTFPAQFEPVIPAGRRPQTQVSDSPTTGQEWVCSWISSIKSPASSAGKGSEPSLMSQVGKVRNHVRVDQCIFAVLASEVPVFAYIHVHSSCNHATEVGRTWILFVGHALNVVIKLFLPTSQIWCQSSLTTPSCFTVNLRSVINCLC